MPYALTSQVSFPYTLVHPPDHRNPINRNLLTLHRIDVSWPWSVPSKASLRSLEKIESEARGSIPTALNTFIYGETPSKNININIHTFPSSLRALPNLYPPNPPQNPAFHAPTRLLQRRHQLGPLCQVRQRRGRAKRGARPRAARGERQQRREA